MKKILATSLIMCIVISTIAHEFWISPTTYIINQPSTIQLKFNVGEDFLGENWKGDATRVVNFTHYLPNGKSTNISPRSMVSKGDSLPIEINEQGTHMITFTSKNSFIQLNAEKFTSYLLEDGLHNAIDYRKANNEDSTDGKEFYQRNCKTIVQYGNNVDANCTKKTSLTLDIVPRDNPYEILTAYDNKVIHDREYTVYFKGKPLAATKVMYWCKQPNGILLKEETTTNKKGRFSFTQKTGETMISCVKMERLQTNGTAQWQSYWGNLTFYYKAGNFFKKTSSTLK